jgi:large subunit ribosomal protein L18
MNKQVKKHQAKARRAHRTRARVTGTPERPRLRVNRTLHHISCQVIDDTTGRTLAFADDRELKGTKTERAFATGKKIAEVAKAAGVTTVVFDRGSYIYHGRVKSLADGAREAGLNF